MEKDPLYIEDTGIVGKTVASVVNNDGAGGWYFIRINFTDGTWTALSGDHHEDSAAGVSFGWVEAQCREAGVK